jgi:hypothetical protein
MYSPKRYARFDRAVLSIAIALPLFVGAAFARPPPCPNGGNITILSGVASQQRDESGGTIWVLRTDRPFCLTVTPPIAPRQRLKLSSVQIVGMPPPTGVTIELKGTLYASPLLPDGSELPRLVVSSGRRITAITPTPAPHQSAPSKEWGGVALYDPAPGTFEFEQMRAAADLTVPCVLDVVRLWLRSPKTPATDDVYGVAMRICPLAYVDTLTRLRAPAPVPQAMAAIGQEVDFDLELFRAGILPLY